MPIQEPLLYPSDYDDAPEDNTDAFLHLESLVRTRMYENADQDANGDIEYPARMEYVTRVGALAQVYEIPGIVFDDNHNNFDWEFRKFIESVDYQTTQISALRAKARRRKTVALSDIDKRKIAHHVAGIRSAIEAAKIDERKRKALLKRLTDLEAEVVKGRSSPAPVLIAAAFALSIAADVSELSDTVGGAAAAIIKIVGQTRLASDIEDQDRIPPPPKQIPAPANIKRKELVSSYDDLDDDIPF
ncbi:MAG: hypothetical protein HKO08_04335 [Erythrobacter sp.]|nr:hypothetical protein [Erythrobacter sp.]